MRTNEDLQLDVENAIKWEPVLEAAAIGVTAQDGIVTLTGTVDNYAKKLKAEVAVKGVSGVKALVESIEVRPADGWGKGDNELAKEILDTLNRNWDVPTEKLKVRVENGWVTLDGDLKWNHERLAALNAVGNVRGVIGISNNIKIRSEKDGVEKKDIKAALERNWYFNDQDIEISVSGNNVILNGRVTSFYAKDEAEQIAWNEPGVSTVDNKIVIVSYDLQQ